MTTSLWIFLAWAVLVAAAIPILLRRRAKAAPPHPPPPADAVDLDEIRRHIDRRVAEGFDSPDIIAETTADCFELEGRDRELETMVTQAMASHLDAQRQWPAKTDCDRLDHCFDELEKDGIVARQNFTCCQTCGHAEIEEAKKTGAVAGYTFYHQQDTERAAEGGGIFLAYGSLSGEEEKTLEVARRVVDALARAGLQVDWDGTTSKRIGVPLDWKRRR